MIKLVYCVYRRNDISETDFHEYWLNVHGPKVRSVARDIGAVKYVQSRICAPELNQMLKESRGLAPAYDGITEVWWENAEAMAEAVDTDAGAAGMQMLLEDESTFIDFGQSTVFMTTETEIFNYTSAGEGK